MIATSTAEVEFYSLCCAAPQAIGQKSLLKDIGETVTSHDRSGRIGRKGDGEQKKSGTRKPHSSAVLVGPEVGEGWRYRFDLDSFRRRQERLDEGTLASSAAKLFS